MSPPVTTAVGDGLRKPSAAALATLMLTSAREHLDLEVMWMTDFDDEGRRVVWSVIGNTEVLEGLGPLHPSVVSVPIVRLETTLGILNAIPRHEGQPNLGRVAVLVDQLKLLAAVLMAATDRPGEGLRNTRHEIRQMIADDRITPVFQPIYSAVDGTLTGVEVLSRFPDGGRPDQWFAAARSSGCGVELELAAIRAALRRLPEFPDIMVNFNASPATMVSPRLLELLAETSSHRLVVELTEHEAVDNYDDLTEAVGALRALGVRIAIDDVGAGFANFAHILHLRPDIVKIDMSLTRGNESDRAKQQVIRAIVRVASEIDAMTVGEGVETPAEVHSLAELGVTHMQGFVLATPTQPPFEPAALCLAAVPTAVRARLGDRDRERATDQQFAVTFEHSPIGMANVGLDGQIRHVNPALASLLQRSVAELEALSFKDITHPDDLPFAIEMFNESLNGQRSGYRIDTRCLAPSGDIILVDLTSSVLRDEAGGPYGFICQVVDLGSSTVTLNAASIEGMGSARITPSSG